MRNRIIAALCTLLAWAPVAFAQEESGEVEYEGEVGDDEVMGDLGETGSLEVAPPSRPQNGTRVRTAEGATAPGEVHTVVTGDTLWDLSQSYLGSPWYWPKVWSYNPEIANPHWIYPGNKIRFFPAGEEVPSRVEVGTAPQELYEDVESPSMLSNDESVVQVAGKIAYTPKSTGGMRLQGFMTSKELAEAGKITGSFAESLMLSAPDTVYLQFKGDGQAQVGQDYVIFRTVKEVEHPVSGKDLGYLSHFLGRARVMKVTNGIATAQITETWDVINRGDLVGPVNEDLRINVVTRPNRVELNGYVVEMMVPFLTMVGEHQIILVDRGSADQVQVGNVFTVVRQQDGAVGIMNVRDGDDAKWPPEAIATCVVIDTKDKTSSCLINRSIREVVRGDQVVMVPQGAGAMSAR